MNNEHYQRQNFGSMKTLITLLFATLLVSCQHYDKEVHKELPPIYSDITVRTSEDNKLRFYSWEDDRSGTASSYCNAVEYLTEDSEITRIEKTVAELITGMKDELSPGYEIIKIYTLSQNKYIIIAHGKECSSIGCGLVAALQIKNDKLIPVNALDGNSYITFEYNFFDDKFEDMSDEELEYWAWLCKYDSINQTLSLRQFSKDGDVTNAYKCYTIR